MDKKIKQYLKKQTGKHREIIDKIRNLILTNFPDIKETGMAEGLWYGGKFYITAFKDHVNLGVGVSGLTKEELKYFEGKGKSMRHIKFFSPEDINDENLLNLMRLVYRKTKCDCDIVWKNA